MLEKIWSFTSSWYKILHNQKKVITKTENIALKPLKEQENIAIKPADKGGAVDDELNLLHRKGGSSTVKLWFLQQLNTDPTQSTMRKINFNLQEMNEQKAYR